MTCRMQDERGQLDRTDDALASLMAFLWIMIEAGSQELHSKPEWQGILEGPMPVRCRGGTFPKRSGLEYVWTLPLACL